MISAGEIGSVFTVIDKATEVLTRIASGMERVGVVANETQLALDKLHMPTGLMLEIGKVDGALKSIMDATTKLDGSFQALGGASSGVSARLISGFGEVDAAITTSIGRVDALQAKLAELAVPAIPEVAAAGSGGGVRRRGGRASGGAAATAVADDVENTDVPGMGMRGRSRQQHDMFHIQGQRQRFGLDGGPHIGIGGTAGTIAGTLLYGVFEEGKIEDIVTEALITGQQQVDSSVTKEGLGKTIRDQIREGSARSGFDYHAEGDALLRGERLFGAMPVKQRLELMNTILPYAETEARMKGTSLPESTEAFIELAHQSGIYDPAGVKEMARNFAYTSLVTPSTPGQFVNTLSYSLPMLHSELDMDPSTAMFLTAAAQSAGIKSTKSGTWLKAFYKDSEPSVGLDGAALTKTQVKHNAALRDLGELDSANQPTWHVNGPDGKMDWTSSVIKQAEILREHLSKLEPATRVAAIQAAYGERGGGFASLFNNKQFVEQLPILAERMKTFKGGDDSLEQYATGSPVQQARLALADFNNAMSDLGQNVMPQATAAVHAFDGLMKTPKDEEKKPWYEQAWDQVFGSDLKGFGKMADKLVAPDPNDPRHGRPETWAEKAHALQHPYDTAPPPSTVAALARTPAYTPPTPTVAALARMPARPYTPLPSWWERHNPLATTHDGVTGGSAPTPSGPVKVSMSEPVKIAGITPVSGRVDAAVTGAVSVTNLGEIVGALTSAVHSAMASVAGAGMTPNQSAFHDDHSHFAMPDASVG